MVAGLSTPVIAPSHNAWEQQQYPPLGLSYSEPSQVSRQKLSPTSQRHILPRKMSLVPAGHSQ